MSVLTVVLTFLAVVVAVKLIVSAVGWLTESRTADIQEPPPVIWGSVTRDPEADSCPLCGRWDPPFGK